MKCVWILVFFLVSFASNAIVIGRVDIQKILTTVKQGQAVRNELKKEFDAKDKIIKDEEKAIAKLQKDFETLGQTFRKQSLVMSDKKKAEKEKELQEKGMEIQQKMIQTEAEGGQVSERDPRDGK